MIPKEWVRHLEIKDRYHNLKHPCYLTIECGGNVIEHESEYKAAAYAMKTKAVLIVIK